MNRKSLYSSLNIYIFSGNAASLLGSFPRGDGLQGRILLRVYNLYLNSWSVPIEKLMFWRVNAWIKHEAKSSFLFLRIYADQLLLTADNKVLETLNMQCKMKGVFKGDILILIITDSAQHLRKLKFQIKSNPALCFQKLGEHFPVIQHNSNNSENTNVRFRNVKDVLKATLEAEGKTQGYEMPGDFKNFVKLCLLDPTFPNFVHETKNVLDTDGFM